MTKSGYIENSIINPFIFGRPLEPEEPFFGRGDDLSWLEYSAKKANIHQPLFLIGSPGTGKTTLVKRLVHSPELQNLTTIIIDTPHITQSDVREFFWGLSQSITKLLASRDKRAPPIQKRMLVLRPAHEFKKEFWMPLDESLGGERILLAFDKAEVLFTLQESDAQGHDTLDIILQLYSKISQIEFLFVLSDNISQNPSGARFLSDGTRIRLLKNFSFDQSVDIINQLHPYRITGDVRRYIHDLTGGHPNDLQRLCYMLYERCLQMGITHITMADIAVALQMDHAPGDYFMPVFRRRNIYKYKIP